MKFILLSSLVFAVACGEKNDKKNPTSQDLVATPASGAVASNNTDAISGNSSGEGAAGIPATVVVASETAVKADIDINAGGGAVDTAPANQLLVNATSSTAATFLKIEAGKLVTTTADQAWILSVKRTNFQTNSGTSGTLNFGVINTASSDYSSITSCTAGTLAYDETIPASGAPGSVPSSGNPILKDWYNYNLDTHTVTSKKLVYLVSNGTSCFKFQITDYDSGSYKVIADALDIPPPPAPAPVVQDVTLDASSTTASAYFKLEAGLLVPTTIDSAWMFAVKRTQFQTNSGTSGTRGVGFNNTGSTDFTALTSTTDMTFTYDAMLPASGAPGSLPFSGNAILNDWYNYDPNTHIVSSKQLVYVLCDASECVKLQLVSYASGIFTAKVLKI